METPGEIGAAGTVLSARLFFVENSLPETALKVARLIEGASLTNGCVAHGRTTSRSTHGLPPHVEVV
jgi:hypothetical protein